MLKMIWAQDKARGIGLNGDMPWRIPEDFQHFKRTTMGCPVIMGRTTWESLGGKPLPGRENIVISRSKHPEIEAAGAEVADMAKAEKIARHYCQNPTEHAFIIGGSQIYAQFMALADELIVSEVDSEFEVDAFAPEISPEKWQTAEASDWQDSKSGVSWRVVRYTR